MAVLDEGDIVIRIVYDGPPLAGKTTNLRALEGMLSERKRSPIFSPGEVEGRTTHFDWLEYSGGWWDGHQVRCQIVTVPGQRRVRRRRLELLREADVVVFVAETTSEGLTAAEESLQELRGLLSGLPGPQVPVVVQANKQDLPVARPAEEARARLCHGGQFAVVGAVADAGRGVRETFTFAVRLALDRVRVLAGDDALSIGAPDVRSGQDLLAWLEAREAEEAPEMSFVAPARSEAPPASEFEPAGTAGPEPRLPDAAVPTGLVWRPMAGRILLQAVQGEPGELSWSAEGGWRACLGPSWVLHSGATDVFADIEEGRRHLLRVARVHAALEPLLSKDRALVLADDGVAAWRLWSLVRCERTLRDDFEEALATGRTRTIAETLAAVTRTAAEASQRFAWSGSLLPAGLDTVGGREVGPVFVDTVRIERGGIPEETPSPDEVVRQVLRASVDEAVKEYELYVPRLLDELRMLAGEKPEHADSFRAIARLLLGDD